MTRAADSALPGGLPPARQFGRPVHGGRRQPRAISRVLGPVDLLASRIGCHQELAARRGGRRTVTWAVDRRVRDDIEGAHTVDRHAQRGAERARRDQADAQPGVGARPDPGRHGSHRRHREARLREHRGDGRHKHLTVTTGVDCGRLGEDPVTVVQRHGDRRGGCVKPK